MSEADEDKPKHCNLASMLYDLGLLFPSRRTSYRDIYRTIVLSFMKLHNAWLLKTSSNKIPLKRDASGPEEYSDTVPVGWTENCALFS